MPKRCGPERNNFGGEFGLITETRSNGKPRYYWRCSHCNFELGGKVFPNEKARIHLSGDASLRNGMIAVVCPRASEDVQQQFREIIAEKRAAKLKEKQCRKRARELTSAILQSASASPAKQSKLFLKRGKQLEDDEVDEAWARAFFCAGYCTQQNWSRLFSRSN